MRNSLYKSICESDCKKITFLIKAGHDVNGVNALGESPLYFLFGSDAEINIKQYEAAIILLEAGANPLKKEPDNILYKRNSALLMSISRHHLAKVLLLSWYIKVDYFRVFFQFTSSKPSVTVEKPFVTLGEFLEIQDEAEERDGNNRKYLDHIKLVIADAAAVRSLEARAKAQKSLADTTADPATYIAAAEIYKQITQIYQKHHNLEDSRNYTVFYPELLTFDDSATPEQLHDLFKKYYQQKKRIYLEQEFACCRLAEQRFAPVDEEGIRQHLAIIDRLIELSKTLGKTELLNYLTRAAEVSMRLPDRRASEASTIASPEDVATEIVSDDERTALLATSAMFGVRRRHPATTDTSADVSVGATPCGRPY